MTLGDMPYRKVAVGDDALQRHGRGVVDNRHEAHVSVAHDLCGPANRILRRDNLGIRRHDLSSFHTFLRMALVGYPFPGPTGMQASIRRPWSAVDQILAPITHSGVRG